MKIASKAVSGKPASQALLEKSRIGLEVSVVGLISH